MDWIGPTIAVLRDLIPWLSKKARNSGIHKKHIIRELRDNLKVFEHAFRNHIEPDLVIDNLSNEAIKNAIDDGYDFDKLKRGKIGKKDINDNRNKIYEGWTASRLIDKIDEKIEELRTIKRLNKSVTKARNTNISLMLSNLYFRMKLLAEFIRG